LINSTKVSSSIKKESSKTVMDRKKTAQKIEVRNKTEHKLKETAEKFRYLIKHAPTPIYEIDYHGPKFKSVNDAMCQTLGYSEQELLAMNPLDLL
jgi:PAS domain-containing protein